MQTSILITIPWYVYYEFSRINTNLEVVSVSSCYLFSGNVDYYSTFSPQYHEERVTGTWNPSIISSAFFSVLFGDQITLKVTCDSTVSRWKESVILWPKLSMPHSNDTQLTSLSMSMLIPFICYVLTKSTFSSPEAVKV